MKLSKYFLPLIKENPQEATIVSHRLMLRAGMIRQVTSGIYSWLPFGYLVLNNISAIIKNELDNIGCLEMLMPSIQPAELWTESGRYSDYGDEMLRIKDRHNRDMLFGPTHEEIITDIFRKNVKSYKDLPKNFYQIQWKFRDEIRPRFGVMRGREFLMKDAYSFDLDYESAKSTYNLYYLAYFRIFKKLGLNAIAVNADSGAIGGNLSHEFHIITNTGESEIFYDSEFDNLIKTTDIDLNKFLNLYAVADKKHDPANCPIPLEKLRSKRGIEVGHIFYFGNKYSKAFNASVTNSCGELIFPEMGSYGIGVSRLVGAIIESSFDDLGIIWPIEIAPFKISLINLQPEDPLCIKVANELYHQLKINKVNVLYDDTKNTAGNKLATHDLIGSPWQIIIGPKALAKGYVELKNRKTLEKHEVTIQVALEKSISI